MAEPSPNPARPGLLPREDATLAYLGLGSNLEPRRQNLASALRMLDEPGGGIRVSRRSRLYETAPWGVTGQPDFLNCAVEIVTTLQPYPLLRRAKEIEDTLGRQPGPRFGPRVIDVDILLYGGLILDEPDLQIPHPRLHLRAFALIPLAELAPSLQHPALGLTIKELAEDAEGREGVRLFRIGLSDRDWYDQHIED